MSNFINGDGILEYLLKNRKKVTELEAEMESFAKENKIPILDYKSAELLEFLIELKKPFNVLELGTAIAYSSIKIAKKLPPEGILDTIEKSKDNIPLATNFIKKSNLQSKINLIFGEAVEVLQSINKKYDFIFLDADKQDYEKLLNIALPLLNKDGIIFVDNLLWKGYVASNFNDIPPNYRSSTQQVLHFNSLFLNIANLDAKIYPIGDGIGIGIKRE